MRILLDGTVYSWQRRGGISRIYNEILPRMCDSAPELFIRLLTETRELAQGLPHHRRIRRSTVPSAKALRPKRIFRSVQPLLERKLARWWRGTGKGAIWHTTYYTLPERWKGAKLVPVYDLLHFRFAKVFNSVWDDEERERMRRCVREADCIIAISETTRNDIGEFHGASAYERTRVVPLACSSSFKLAEQGMARQRREKPFLLFVGDRNHYKNFGLLLQAFARWEEREVELVVVGDKFWSTAEIAQIDELGIQERVTWLGAVDDAQLAGLYQSAVAFVYPSLYEGFGIPLLEAMACGCPIVASDIPSTIEVAGSYPVLFDPTEVDSLVMALRKVLTGSRTSDGAERAKKFSWKKTAQQTLEIYRELSVSW